MSINQKSGWQTFRRRFVSGSLFVSPCPPDCNFQSETKVEPDLRLNPIRWITQLVSLILIRWTVIYPVDNAIYMTGSRASIWHVMPLDDPSVILSFSKEKAHSITEWHIQSYTFWNVAITAQRLLPSAHPFPGARSGRAGSGKLAWVPKLISNLSQVEWVSAEGAKDAREASQIERNLVPRFSLLPVERTLVTRLKRVTMAGDDLKLANKRKRALRKPGPGKLKWLALKSLRSKLSITVK